MASTACFLHNHAISTPASTSLQRYVPPLKPNQIACRPQKQAAQEDDGNAAAVSRRLALTVLIGAAAVVSKVSPADAAYGEAGITTAITLEAKAKKNSLGSGPDPILWLKDLLMVLRD